MGKNAPATYALPTYVLRTTAGELRYGGQGRAFDHSPSSTAGDTRPAVR
jgi:hypothetical protein